MTRRLTTLAAILLLALLPSMVSAKELVSGTVIFAKACKADDAKDEAADEAAFPILAPLLTGIVSQGLKMAGTKLTEAAQEQTVDAIHRGDHLYRREDTSFVWQYTCWIVASKGTYANSGRSLADLVSGYEHEIAVDEGENDSLSELLTEHGFGEERLPGIVAVFDLELSDNRTAARLIPRFVVMDHSIRERRADKKERTMTFEVSLSVPGQAKPVADLLIKLDQLTTGNAFEQSEDAGPRIVTSAWFSLPGPDKGSVDFLGKQNEAEEALAAAKSSARVVGKAASGLGNDDIKDFLDTDPYCPTEEVAEDRWKRTSNSLREAKLNSPSDKQKISRLELTASYFETCIEVSSQEKRSERLQKTVEGLVHAGPFDLNVAIKEFRKRPFAEFFGGVLSSDSTRAALSSAIVGEFDPATQAKEEEETAAKELEARKAYEAALTAALTAINTHEIKVIAEAAGEITSYELEIARLDMESKKRAVNRAAKDLGISLPYPEAGLWG